MKFLTGRPFPNRMFLVFSWVALAIAALWATGVHAHDDGKDGEHPEPTGGGSGAFTSSNRVQQLGRLTVSQLGGVSLNNDIWGWTDSATGREYALVGLHNGTSFVDVTNPSSPTLIGRLPPQASNSAWRDIKVYQDYAYIVSEAGGHGLQIFDLTELRTTTPGTVFSTTPGNPDAPGNSYLFHHTSFGNAHNIAINESTGFAYIVGSSRESGGLHVLDLNVNGSTSSPIKPAVSGVGFSADGYTHDVQVVTYQGADTSYVGKEIAFASNTDTLTIVDMSNKSAPVQLSRTTYTDSAYAHQGWLSDDHEFFFMNDELDEPNTAPNTRTHIWDVKQLGSPQYLGFYEANLSTKDHNLYVHEGLIYAANYTSGLRILDPTSAAGDNSRNPSVTEIGFLDTFPTNNDSNFNGAWSVYPFFDSGTVIVNDRSNGLFTARLLKGDADNDGDIDNSDMLIAIGNFTGPNQPTAGKRFEHGSFDGDGDVDNSDMLTAIGNFTGPGGSSIVVEEAVASAIVDGSLVDRPNHTNLLYDPLTGNLKIDPSEGAGGILAGYVLQSDNEFFAANHQTHLGGTETSLASELSEANNSSMVSSTIDLGNVLPTGLSQLDLEALLTTADYTGQSGTGVHDLDLIVVPEPSSVALAVVGAILLLGFARIWRRK